MRRRVVAALVPVALGLVACGEPEPPSASGTVPATGPAVSVTTTSTLPGTTGPGALPTVTAPPMADDPGATTSIWPATTVFDPNVVGIHPASSIEAIESVDATVVTEPCPVPDPNVPAGGAITDEMAKLEPMLGAVLRYGGEHREQFASYGLVWHAQTDASVILAMTGDVATHRAAVQTMVDHPDEVIVCQAPLSADQVAGVQAALSGETGDRVTSWSSTWGTLEVGVAATEEAYAAELLERYGDAVRLTVGALPYPDPGSVSQCGPPRAAAPSGLVVTLPPADAIERSASGISFTATITNTSSDPIEISGSSTLAATLLDASGRPISSLAGIGFTSDLVTNLLQPGESADRAVRAGIASCDPAVGYAVPPGTYDLVVELDRSDAGSSTSPVPFHLT